MARPREFDIDEAVARIAERFWADGYEGTGINDLVEATGVARASLYGAFGSKRAMLYRAIEFYLSGQIEELLTPVDNGGLDGAAEMFRRLAWVREHKPERALMGCLMVNSMVELGDRDSTVWELGQRYRDRIRSAFRSALQRAEADGELRGSVEDLVDVAWMLLMGLFVSIRSGAPLEEVQRLAGSAVRVVDSWRAG